MALSTLMGEAFRVLSANAVTSPSASAIPVTHGACAFGRWERAVGRPDPRIADQVIGYTGVISDLALDRERHLPSGEAALVVNLGAPSRVIDQASGATTEHSGVAVMGAHDRRFVTEGDGRKHMLVVRLRPAAAGALLHTPMDRLANRWVALGAIDAGLTDEIQTRVGAAPDWAGRFRALDAILCARLADAPDAQAGAASAWETMRRVGGRVRVRQLAAGLGWSHRRLIDQFRLKVGLTPKTAARVLRFNRVLRKPAATWRDGGAELALDCGYADQAHMIAEFGAFAGGSPGQIRRLIVGYTLRA
jgi:AraC-like DNA-binding protein